VILNLTFQDLKQIALAGRVEKNGITLVVGRPLIPDLKTDARGPGVRCGLPSMNPTCVLAGHSWSSRVKVIPDEEEHRSEVIQSSSCSTECVRSDHCRPSVRMHFPFAS